MLEYAATALVTFFVIIDPVGVLPIFMMLTRDQENKARRQTAIKSILVASVILIVFAGAGEFFLRLLGITLPAFRIAGGILLLLLSIDMVFARQSGIRTTTDVVEATEVFVDHRLLLKDRGALDRLAAILRLRS
jgi:multiple antibiotic resistance protein